MRQLVPIDTEVSTLPRKYGCEGKTHRMLKQVATNMLAKLGETEVKLEQNNFDVYGAKLGIVVECGNMSITKIYEALINNNVLKVKEIWHLSFPRPENICVLTKIKLDVQLCRYFNYCKPNEWSKHSLSSCKLRGKECFIRRQYLLRDCPHLNGYETLTSTDERNEPQS